MLSVLFKCVLRPEGAVAVFTLEVVGGRVFQVLFECMLGLESAVAVFTLEPVGGRVAVMLSECIRTSVRPTTWVATCSHIVSFPPCLNME